MDERNAGGVAGLLSESHQTQDDHQKPVRGQKLSQSPPEGAKETRVQDRRRCPIDRPAQALMPPSRRSRGHEGADITSDYHVSATGFILRRTPVEFATRFYRRLSRFVTVTPFSVLVRLHAIMRSTIIILPRGKNLRIYES